MKQKKMIDSVVWKLGGAIAPSKIPTMTDFYITERGTTVFGNNPTEWIGEVGLIYPSDYGYATSGGSTVDRSACLNKSMYYWDSYSDCYMNSWLHYTSQYTITTRIDAEGYIVGMYKGVSSNINLGKSELDTKPVIYLTPNLKIASGTGSSTDPFILSS